MITTDRCPTTAELAERARKRDSELATLRDEGMSVKEIAKRFDLTPARIYFMLRRHAQRRDPRANEVQE
jgi:Mor family transcriptional regulator